MSTPDEQAPRIGTSSAAAPRPAQLPFPVVGIGASAGGIEALQEFFKGTPPDSGMAYVVVQHLSPEHQSLMEDILSRGTSMPVRQIEDGLSVEPDHVYVIAPARTLTLQQGQLRLSEPTEQRGHRRPVDDFFKSLAAEQKEKSIAVILSGTGTNGTAGAQAMAAGGICIAQDPESASFPGMPRSLINAGYADQVLPPAEIARVLQRYASQPYVGIEPQERAAEEALERQHTHLREVLAILRTRTRHDFNGYRKPTLLRRIQRRMSLLGVQKLDGYAQVLREDVEEVQALANDLMINVTGFFRDPEAWEALRVGVIGPLIAAKEEGETLRCWVTACASGEEAYTLAILIAEEKRTAGKENLEVKIFATDTADKSLELARAGVFPGGIESDLSPERLDRFFDKDEHTLRVKKELRDMVVFAPQDVLRDPPFSHIDLATCRNLLIYLEPETQQRVVAFLHFALNNGGYLFLGNSETYGGSEHLFELISRKWRIYRKTGGGHVRVSDVSNFALRPESRTGEPIAAFPTGRPSATLLLQRALLERYGPPTVVVDRADQIVYFHGTLDAYLQHPIGEPTRDVLQLVRTPLRMGVRAALRSAMREGRAVTAQARLEAEGPPIEIRAEPVVPGKAPEFFLVSFSAAVQDSSAQAGSAPEERFPRPVVMAGSEEELRALRTELQHTIEAFEATHEELKASNEEATSVNEELQSTNEELETGKEELQSVNEELTTVNGQLQSKIAQLEATTNDLANLLSSTDIAVVFLDTDLRVRRFTPAVSELFALIDADIGRPISNLAMKFEDAQLLHDARAVLQKLTPREREVQSHGARWYLRRVHPYRTADDRIEGVVITFVDIAARKRAEDEIRLSQERLQAVLDQMPLAVLITESPSGRLLSANRRAAEMFGESVPFPVPAKDAPPVFPVMQGAHPSGAPYRSAEWPMARALAKGEVIIDEEIEVEKPNGESALLSVSAAPVRHRDGTVLAVVGTFSDVTRRRATERKLGMAEERFRLLVESATEFAIFFIEPRGRISLWNRGAERVLGWNEKEIVGQPFEALFTPEERAVGMPQAQMQQALQAGHAVDDRWHVRKDGTRFWASGVLSPVRTADGEVSGFVKVMRDMTERKLSEEQLAAVSAAAELARIEANRASKSKDEFIATVSHELRTPLNTIRLWSRMLDSERLSPADRASGLQMIERAILAQQQLVDDLLDVSRITAGTLRLTVRAVRMADVIRAAAEAIAPVAKERGIRFAVQVAADIGTVRADADRLQQVIWNLLSNAVKFTPPEGAVSLAAAREGEMVTITVTDTGAGIRPEFLPSLFAPFSQGETGITRGHGGLGLGLSIVKQLVALHGGTIEVHSPGEGRGTTFTVRLPIGAALARVSEQEEKAQRHEAPELAGLEVLLVEDEAVSRDTMRVLLETQGAHVRAVNSARAARDEIRARLPGVIVSDIGLPEEDGYSLLRSVRSLNVDGAASVPALAVTAFARAEDRERAQAAGFDAYLAKPVDAAELLETVARLAKGRAKS